MRVDSSWPSVGTAEPTQPSIAELDERLGDEIATAELAVREALGTAHLLAARCGRPDTEQRVADIRDALDALTQYCDCDHCRS